jgi:chemotaxis protein MotA
MEFVGKAELQYMLVIRDAMLSFANGMAPLVACEVGRRALSEDVRPSSSELETMLKTMK